METQRIIHDLGKVPHLADALKTPVDFEITYNHLGWQLSYAGQGMALLVSAADADKFIVALRSAMLQDSLRGDNTEPPLGTPESARPLRVGSPDGESQAEHDPLVKLASVSKASYIGDGVYADIEFGMIVLRVNDHRNSPAVFLEPQVLVNLIAYAKTWEIIK